MNDALGNTAHTISFNNCIQECAASNAIISQTLSPVPFQISYSVTTPVSILSFMMHTDSVGMAHSNIMFCGVKNYSTGLTWLTVLTPADPLTQNFELQVTTNNYNLANTYSVSLLVKFANLDYPATLTQVLTVTLIHPCKTTMISTS